METEFNAPGLPRLTLVREFKGGENNHSYLYEDAAGQRYVLRVKKAFATTGALSAERDALRFLDAAGIDFAPRSLFYDDDRGLHVISYVEGRDVRPFDFSESEASLFARQLARLHEVPPAFYEEWCRKEGVKPKPVETLADNLGLYFTGPAAFVKTKCPDAVLARWAAEKVEPYVARAMARPRYPATFVHGDLGGNMKLNGDALTFIDWERARFLELNELGYIFVHGETPPALQNVIQSAYAQARGMDPARVAEQTAFEVELLNIDKVLWRANKFTEMHVAGAEGAERYRLMAHEALDLLP